MTSKISTCLWFDGNGEEAAKLYVSLIPGSELISSFRPGPDGPPLLVDFVLGGAPYQTLNAGPQFPHSEAASIVVHTEDQAETDRLWNALIADGGSESMCGWLRDKFGVSWQIVPEVMLKAFRSPDKAAAARAMDAMMKMRKIDIATIETAFRG
jgi:predicted 3-demethylubiquinone-9 3-methyltransferase (glyoxalase superfamily)